MRIGRRPDRVEAVRHDGFRVDLLAEKPQRRFLQERGKQGLSAERNLLGLDRTIPFKVQELARKRS